MRKYCISRQRLHLGSFPQSSRLKHGQAVLNAARVTFRHLTAGLGMSRMSGLPKASADEDDKRFQQCPRYGTKHTDPK